MTRQDADAFVPDNPDAEAATSCPKCHRPIEGVEQYVCCADAAVWWRCDLCSKVSEGFAFPYGMCPACGGRLRGLEERHIQHKASEDAIRVAFEIELGGMAFYENAAKEAPDKEMSELFGKLAEMEKGHLAALVRRYHVEVPASNEPCRRERASIYAGIPDRPEDPANLFHIAIGFEGRAARFFFDRHDQCAEGSPERQLYKELAAEEREHFALLTTELARWNRGKPGLL